MDERGRGGTRVILLRRVQKKNNKDDSIFHHETICMRNDVFTIYDGLASTHFVGFYVRGERIYILNVRVGCLSDVVLQIIRDGINLLLNILRRRGTQQKVPIENEHHTIIISITTITTGKSYYIANQYCTHVCTDVAFQIFSRRTKSPLRNGDF